ncbi:SET family sugar efflux transporter-like MFS transporter [Kribbella aluminosa]|uniref:SET family sugar efflux transporter-like MFS transporter n=1 Tax=Kribbella aluminosa TaxID=416017 RepID=A0ABS4ULG1_9ACTN|nr:MFS transporter [Kribbella aluminosa]MBP2352491.1 SET family sugar efflux transporter-like MFS transporter [Kribbella aluminosa]
MHDRPESALGIVLRSRFYRSAFLSLLVAGIGVSAATPQLTLFLVRELHTPLPVAGLYYVTNLAAPRAGFLVGRWSDRSHDRLLWFRVCAVIGAAGWLAMAASTKVWMPFVISALALSVAGGSMAQLFAACRDELSRHPTRTENRVIATIRMAFTTGWILGPVFGSWFGGVFGLRPLLVATAVCVFAQVLPLGRQRVERYDDPHRDTSTERRRIDHMLPLLVFTAVCVLAMTGDTIKFGYLPIYMADQLHVSDAVRGAVIGIQPLLELLLLPVVARLADRYGAMRAMTAGAVLGLAGNITYALSTSVAGLFLGQALTAGLWACVGALGVTIAQRLYPEGVGTASGIFLSAIPLGSAIGGTIGGIGVAAIGLPHVFFVPACLTAVSIVAFAVLSTRTAHSS